MDHPKLRPFHHRILGLVRLLGKGVKRLGLVRMFCNYTGQRELSKQGGIPAAPPLLAAATAMVTGNQRAAWRRNKHWEERRKHGNRRGKGG